MDIKTRREGKLFKVTATEGKGAYKVTVAVVVAEREEAVSVAIHGCYELVKMLNELNLEN